jgi:hypothetical protein
MKEERIDDKRARKGVLEKGEKVTKVYGTTAEISC